MSGSSSRQWVVLSTAYGHFTSCTNCTRVSTEMTFGRGDLSVCPFGGFTGAHAYLVYNWKGVIETHSKETACKIASQHSQPSTHTLKRASREQ